MSAHPMLFLTALRDVPVRKVSAEMAAIGMVADDDRDTGHIIRHSAAEAAASVPGDAP